MCNRNAGRLRHSQPGNGLGDVSKSSSSTRGKEDEQCLRSRLETILKLKCSTIDSAQFRH